MADAMLAQIRLVDELLLAAVPGREPDAVAWVAQRQRFVERLLPSASLADLEELQHLTRRLEDRFLHWRRSSIMELSLIERHLRYLHEQPPDAVQPVPALINLSA